MTSVLIIGGRGFIGRHLAAALTTAGHRVTAVGRDGIDLIRDNEADLAAKFAGHGLVVNAAGLVRSRGANSMAAVHAEGTERLIHACCTAAVPRLIHLSALGAAPDGQTAYQRTKGHAETVLAASTGLDWCVLRPSVVIGRSGASTALFSDLAALPLPIRIGPGTWTVQPVHVDDLAALVVRLVSWVGPLPRRIDVVGTEPMSTDTLTTALRAWLDLPSRRFLAVPASLLGVVSILGERLKGGPVNRETLAMLKADNTASSAPFADILGRAPQALPQALARHSVSDADRLHARLFFVQPILRWSLALLWIVTGLLSFGLYPLADSYRLLGSVGLDGPLATLALFGGAGLDLILGFLLLVGWRPVAVGGAMLASVAAFSLLAAGLPAEHWTHPFAPLLKNLPIAAATLAMMAMES